MRNFSRISLGLVGATVLLGSVVLPASADDTTVAANLTAGNVTIDVPNTASLDFGEVAPGTPKTLALTDVTVTDDRAGTTAWGASVQTNGFQFTRAGQTVAETVTGPTLSYAPSAFTGTSGVIGTSTPITVTSVTAAAEVQRPASVEGNNSATWNADVALTLPSNALAGSYSTTLTHSVL